MQLHLLALLLLALLLCSCSAAAEQSHQEQYEKGITLRSRSLPSKSDLVRAANFFAAAAHVSVPAGQGHGLIVFNSSAAPGDGCYVSLQQYPHLLVGCEAHAGALRELGKAFQAGWGLEVHHGLAVELLREAAARGDPEAQGVLGVLMAYGLHHPGAMDAAGIREFGPVDEQQAVLHYYFAAKGGDPLAQLALGYRHLYGLGVPRSCWAAVGYLQLVAEDVLRLAQRPSSLPHLERIRLNVQATQGLKADRHKELLQFYQYSADRGNVEAQTTVGQVLNFGVHGIRRDHRQALRYFQRAAEADDPDPDAQAHLGHMHASGYGTQQDMEAAIRWFEKAAAKKQPSALFSLGYVHLTGTGAERDYAQALDYFSQAAEKGNPEAHFHLGLMYMKGWGVSRKSAQKAFAYFSAASQAGHLLAMYNTAMMHLAGKGTIKKCKPAAALLKQIAERSPVAAALQRGHERFFRGQYSGALLSYLAAAEVGMELAQSNAAWMLQQGYGRLGGAADERAVLLHKRSAEQGNVAALLALGDAHFYGKGVEQDWSRAAAIYYEAYQQRSAEAMFNLGFLHEFGAGVPKDLFLARKFYHMVKHKQPDAGVPIAIANAWLTLHERWDRLRPHLPPALDFVWDRMFVMHAPATSPLGVVADVLSHLPLPQLALRGAMLRINLVRLPLMPILKAVQEVNDTLVLGGLLACLLLVLRARRRRQQPGEAPQAPDAPGTAAAAADAAAAAAAAAPPPPAAAAAAQDDGPATPPAAAEAAAPPSEGLPAGAGSQGAPSSSAGGSDSQSTGNGSGSPASSHQDP